MVSCLKYCEQHFETTSDNHGLLKNVKRSYKQKAISFQTVIDYSKSPINFGKGHLRDQYLLKGRVFFTKTFS